MLTASRVTVVRGREGTQPVVVAVAPSPSAEEAFVQIGVGEPTEVLDRQPDCGCDACDTGSADLLGTLDDAFVLALSGGVYTVREGDEGRPAVARRLGQQRRLAAPRPSGGWPRRPTAGVRTGSSLGMPGSEGGQAIVRPPSTGIICPVT